MYILSQPNIFVTNKYRRCFAYFDFFLSVDSFENDYVEHSNWLLECQNFLQYCSSCLSFFFYKNLILNLILKIIYFEY